MLSVLSGKNNRDMDDVSSMSKRWDSDEIYKAIQDNLLSAENNELDPIFNIGAIPATTVADGDPVTGAALKTVIDNINNRITSMNEEGLLNLRKLGLINRLHGNESKVLSTKLAFGLLHQPKWIPLRYAPLTLELELVNQFTDVVIAPYAVDATQFPGVESRFPENITSKEWSIEQVEVKCDLCTLDNALENSYEAHLLEAKTLPINYNTYISQTQNIVGQTDIAINVSRAISRLKSISSTSLKSQAMTELVRIVEQ